MKKIYLGLILAMSSLQSFAVRNGLSELLPAGNPQTTFIQAYTSNSVSRPNGFTYTVPSGDDRILVLVARSENNGNFPDYPTAATYGGVAMTSGPIYYTTTNNTFKFLNLKIFYLNEVGVATASGNAFNLTYNQPNQNNNSSYNMMIYTLDEYDQVSGLSYCGAVLNGSGTNVNDSIACSSAMSYGYGNLAITHAVSAATANAQPMTTNAGMTPLYNQVSNEIFVGDFYHTVNVPSQMMTPYAVANGANTPRFVMASLGIPVSLTPLPIKVTSFTAMQQGTVNKIIWVSESETGLDRYEIEKSLDGNNFVSVAEFPSKASSGNGHGFTYSYIDGMPGEKTYYRLKLIDNKQTYGYWKVISVATQEDSHLLLYPNPAKGTFTISGVSVTDLRNNLSIFNFLGQKQSFTISSSSANSSVVQLSSAPSGVYFVDYRNAGKELMQKVYIQ
jgi:hypothetical protein